MKLVVPWTVWVTWAGGVLYRETVPKSTVAAFVPEPVSATPDASVTNVRLIELASSADTASVPELVCPCAQAIPDIRIRPVNITADSIVFFFFILSLSAVGRLTFVGNLFLYALPYENLMSAV